MKKKQLEDCEIKHESEFYVITKKNKNDKFFRIYHKNSDTVITCSKYYIIKSAIIYKNEFGSMLYYNEDVPQYYSDEDQEINTLEIADIKYKEIDKIQLILIKYRDENGNIADAVIDADGNFKTISIDTLTSILEII